LCGVVVCMHGTTDCVVLKWLPLRGLSLATSNKLFIDKLITIFCYMN
jgi:hypothetical protein